MEELSAKKEEECKIREQKETFRRREGTAGVQGEDDEEMKARGRGEKTASRCYSWVQVQQCQDYEK